MRIKRYLLTAIVVLLFIFFLAIALSARFSLSNITSDPYEFISSFLRLWAPALSTVGTLVIALLVILILYQIRRTQEREKEQVICALHDEISINLSIVVPLRVLINSSVETHGNIAGIDLKIDERTALFAHIDTSVFDNMKNSGQLHWLKHLRPEIISCYRLIKVYNSDNYFKPRHWELLTNLQSQLDNALRNLENNFSFVPRYTEEKIKEVKLDAGMGLPAKKSKLRR